MERTLAVYQIGAGGALTPAPANVLSGGAWNETELLGLWEEMCTLLPEAPLRALTSSPSLPTDRGDSGLCLGAG